MVLKLVMMVRQLLELDAFPISVAMKLRILEVAML